MSLFSRSPLFFPALVAVATVMVAVQPLRTDAREPTAVERQQIETMIEGLGEVFKEGKTSLLWKSMDPESRDQYRQLFLEWIEVAGDSSFEIWQHLQSLGLNEKAAELKEMSATAFWKAFIEAAEENDKRVLRELRAAQRKEKEFEPSVAIKTIAIEDDIAYIILEEDAAATTPPIRRLTIYRAVKAGDAKPAWKILLPTEVETKMRLNILQSKVAKSRG
jgi:hypothetical protein